MQSKLVKDLKFCLYSLDILVIDLGLCLEHSVTSTATIIEYATLIPNKHLIPLHLLLKLLHLAIKHGKLVLFLCTSFRFDPHQLLIIEDTIRIGGRFLSFSILQVLVSYLSLKLAFLPIDKVICVAIIGLLRVQCPGPMRRHILILG